MEAFVYKWTDEATNMLYVGYHKGDPDDGYVCSSKYMLAEYEKRPEDFSRTIIATGKKKDMIDLESSILKAANASTNEMYYNRHNGGKFYLSEHSEETKRKIGAANKKIRTGSTLSETHKANIGKSIRGEKNGFYGKTHTEETRRKMSEANLGKTMKDSTKEKLSNHWKGRTWTLIDGKRVWSQK